MVPRFFLVAVFAFLSIFSLNDEKFTNGVYARSNPLLPTCSAGSEADGNNLFKNLRTISEIRKTISASTNINNPLSSTTSCSISASLIRKAIRFCPNAVKQATRHLAKLNANILNPFDEFNNHVEKQYPAAQACSGLISNLEQESRFLGQVWKVRQKSKFANGHQAHHHREFKKVKVDLEAQKTYIDSLLEGARASAQAVESFVSRKNLKNYLRRHLNRKDFEIDAKDMLDFCDILHELQIPPRECVPESSNATKKSVVTTNSTGAASTRATSKTPTPAAAATSQTTPVAPTSPPFSAPDETAGNCFLATFERSKISCVLIVLLKDIFQRTVTTIGNNFYLDECQAASNVRRNGKGHESTRKNDNSNNGAGICVLSVDIRGPLARIPSKVFVSSEKTRDGIVLQRPVPHQDQMDNGFDFDHNSEHDTLLGDSHGNENDYAPPIWEVAPQTDDYYRDEETESEDYNQKKFKNKPSPDSSHIIDERYDFFTDENDYVDLEVLVKPDV